MTFLDFFSGIGGFRRGLELCGMVCKGHCEIDQYADRSYRAIFNVKEDEWFEPDITKVEPTGLPGPTCGPEAFPAKIFLLRDRAEGLRESEVRSFLKWLGSSRARLPKLDPTGWPLKMLGICYPFIKDGTLRPFSIRWPKSAIISSTGFSIQNSTASRKTGSGSTLSLIDILEPEVDERYFLSQQAKENLLSKFWEGRKDSVSTPRGE